MVKFDQINYSPNQIRLSFCDESTSNEQQKISREVFRIVIKGILVALQTTYIKLPLK